MSQIQPTAEVTATSQFFKRVAKRERNVLKIAVSTVLLAPFLYLFFSSSYSATAQQPTLQMQLQELGTIEAAKRSWLSNLLVEKVSLELSLTENNTNRESVVNSLNWIENRKEELTREKYRALTTAEASESGE